MKTKLAIFIIALFIYSNFSSQKITILNITKTEKNGYSYFILSCELVNDTNQEIVLPLQNNGKNFCDYLLNYYTGYYRINARPKNIFYKFKFPPPAIGQDFPKLSKDNLLICPSNSSKKFTIDSSKIEEGVFFIDLEKVRKIQIVYSPFPIENKEKYLEDDIKDIQFYDKKIKSKYFKIKKN